LIQRTGIYSQKNDLSFFFGGVGGDKCPGATALDQPLCMNEFYTWNVTKFKKKIFFPNKQNKFSSLSFGLSARK